MPRPRVESMHGMCAIGDKVQKRKDLHLTRLVSYVIRGGTNTKPTADIGSKAANRTSKPTRIGRAQVKEDAGIFMGGANLNWLVGTRKGDVLEIHNAGSSIVMSIFLRAKPSSFIIAPAPQAIVGTVRCLFFDEKNCTSV